MTVLDQAFIKAYAKDQPAGSPERPTADYRLSVGRQEPAATNNRALLVEQIYRHGSLYRLETPVEGQRTGGASSSAPDLHLPPTSPRRGIRRSLLRFLAGQHVGSAATEPSPDAPPRVARKVIIRHIAHQSLPSPRGLLRPTATSSEVRSEAKPESAQPPLPPGAAAKVPTGVPEETATHSPVAPPQIEPQEPLILGSYATELKDWPTASAPAMVVVSETEELAKAVSEALVTVRLDSLFSLEEVGRLPTSGERAGHLSEEVRFTSKTLDDADVGPAPIHIDPPHALAGPHIRFPAEAVIAADAPPSAKEVIAESAAPTTDASSPELHEEPLASDLIPTVGESGKSDATPAASVEVRESRKPTVPLWEVDHFQWPKTCQKLLADETGYFAQAGEKLLAAVRDGLRVLAVTGSRRGEGRTTLALCLAQAAAKTGIHVAIMEGDFARPQLASKLGIDIAFGWQDAAAGKISLSEAAVKSVSDGVTAMPLDPSAARQALSLADPRITATLRAAAATFDLLILDLGPLTAGEELRFPPGEKCPLDAAIVVRDSRFATVLESETIGHKLQDLGVEAVGIAENFVVEKEE